MNSAAVAVAVLSSLLVLCAQGAPGNRSQKCKCTNGFIGRVNPQLIKRVVIHQGNIFCSDLEIIITLKEGNKEKCVNPKSPFAKLLLENKEKSESKAAAAMTTASSQTNTSTRLRNTHSAPRTM